MAGSVNYQHFKTLVEAQERVHSEKNKNTALTAVGKFWKEMKADFTANDELEEEVRKQVNEWKTKKEFKTTDIWSKLYRRKKSDKRVNPNSKSRNN